MLKQADSAEGCKQRANADSLDGCWIRDEETRTLVPGLVLTCRRSVRSAVEHGTQMLELDCHLTHDGHVVVSHDENLLRQTGHDVAMSSLNLQVSGAGGGQRRSTHHSSETLPMLWNEQSEMHLRKKLGRLIRNKVA